MSDINCPGAERRCSLESLILKLQVSSFSHSYHSMQLLLLNVLTFLLLGGEGETGETKRGEKSG